MLQTIMWMISTVFTVLLIVPATEPIAVLLMMGLITSIPYVIGYFTAVIIESRRERKETENDYY